MTDYTLRANEDFITCPKYHVVKSSLGFLNILTLSRAHTTRSWPSWLSSTGSVRGGTGALYFYLLILFFLGWMRALWREVVRGHQVGNLWQSSWCYPCVCFHEPNPSRHTHSNSEPSHVHSHTRTQWHTKKTSSPARQMLEHCKLGIWTKFCEQTGRCQKALTAGFSRERERQGGEKCANTDVL